MICKTLNASRLQQEVDRRIHRLQEVVEDGVKIRVPRPLLQEPDKTGCNWNMTNFGNAVGFERDTCSKLRARSTTSVPKRKTLATRLRTSHKAIGS